MVGCVELSGLWRSIRYDRYRQRLGGVAERRDQPVSSIGLVSRNDHAGDELTIKTGGQDGVATPIWYFALTLRIHIPAPSGSNNYLFGIHHFDTALVVGTQYQFSAPGSNESSPSARRTLSDAAGQHIPFTDPSGKITPWLTGGNTVVFNRYRSFELNLEVRPQTTTLGLWIYTSGAILLDNLKLESTGCLEAEK